MSFEDVDFLRKPAKAQTPPAWPFTLLAMLAAVIWSFLSSLPTTRGLWESGYLSIATILGAELMGMLARFIVVAAGLYFGFFFWTDRTRGAKEFGLIILAILFGTLLPFMGAWAITRTEAPVRDMIAAYNVTVKQDASAYAAALGEHQANRILEPDMLAADPSLAPSLRAAADARQLVARYSYIAAARPQQVRDGIRAKLAAQGKGKKAQEAAVATFDAQLAKAKSATDQYWAREQQILDEIDGALAVLKRARGRWEVREGRILFARASDMAAYGEHMKRIEALTAEQNVLIQAERRRTSR